MHSLRDGDSEKKNFFLEKFNIKDTEGWTEKERKKGRKKDASIESGFSVQIILGTVVAPPPHLSYPLPPSPLLQV